MAKEVEAVALELYPHNQKAYAAAMDSLRQSGKAAIVHPTGTGKSFIGFCLAGQHPADRVLWLTPSEYIVRTQLENLQRASGWQPGNIQFLTYAKLMTLVEEELDALAPKWIVLDEFHRCGAEKWGEGVQRLLQQYPRTPRLGLSATNVRYLDNQRDMAEELFDGRIASYMT
ncbi:DEAD/DEAH box helicase, partial [Allofournierella sp.]